MTSHSGFGFGVVGNRGFPHVGLGSPGVFPSSPHQSEENVNNINNNVNNNVNNSESGGRLHESSSSVIVDQVSSCSSSSTSSTSSQAEQTDTIDIDTTENNDEEDEDDDHICVD